MNRVLNFLREKAFVFILLACILAATGTSIWAIETVRNSLNQGLTQNNEGSELDEGFPQASLEGDTAWDQPVDNVANNMNDEISMDEASDDAQSIAQDSSSSSSGALSSPEPSETPAASETQADVQIPSSVLPVSGLVTKAYSGDELVYSETLCDWRTHNGMDYGATYGETVISPIDGVVCTIETDGNWGGIVEIIDENGVIWRFCGVENSPLNVDDTVLATQEIGVIGEISAESSEGAHLHLEIIKDGVYQNPADYLK